MRRTTVLVALAVLIGLATGCAKVEDGPDPAETAYDALKTAWDEDGLVEACRPLKIFDLLDQCARWEETGNRPSDVLLCDDE